MSELVKKITSTYNDMSKSKKYRRPYLEGYRQCVVDAQDSEPQLNEDQEIVLGWLKENNDKDDVLHPFEILEEHASEGLLEAEPVAAYCFIEDDAMLMVQVIKAFTEWWLSENEL